MAVVAGILINPKVDTVYPVKTCPLTRRQTEEAVVNHPNISPPAPTNILPSPFAFSGNSKQATHYSHTHFPKMPIMMLKMNTLQQTGFPFNFFN